MRLFCIIILFQVILAFNVHGQATTSEIFKIDSLPSKGIVLNKGWRYQAADNMDYSRPDYDDKAWVPLDPTVDILSNFKDKSGIHWLRLNFSIDSNLADEQIAAVIEQYVASEWYLDGKLICKFGTVSQNSKAVVAYNPVLNPVSLPFNGTGMKHLLAVRFSFENGIKFSTGGSAVYPLLNASIFKPQDAYREAKKQQLKLQYTNTFRIGAYFIIALLHLVFFIYKPSQKAYLFFFLYALFYIVGDFLQLNFPSVVTEVLNNAKIYFGLWRVSSMFLLAALYSLLAQKRGLIFWTVIGLAGLGMFFSNWNYGVFLIDLLISFELVRTGLKALRLHTRGAWIIAAGAISYLIFGGLFLFSVRFELGFYNWKLGEIFILGDLLYALMAFSFPVATTIYIALEYAFTSHVLEQKLSEVKELSKKTHDQELEKRQILSEANKTLEKRVEERTMELKQTLDDLTSTQAQLIQSEKMASLGELTAGIAHEIQNPLNFVNNFSDLNTELLDELQIELKKGDLSQANIIAEDVLQNEYKINSHGKRAEAIVKSMLQHSRNSQGQREQQDINKLVDEYTHLTYNALRVKDKDFNAALELLLDPTTGSVNIVAQDIGRVLLNLLNNSFYAVTEKSKTIHNGYDPLVKVRTKKSENVVEISVLDNGNGIEERLRDKIFQPFFTTKPTGQGTGLGLSLSYDIVKSHGGDIKLNSQQGEFTEVTIYLPS